MLSDKPHLPMGTVPPWGQGSPGKGARVGGRSLQEVEGGQGMPGH